MANVQEANVQKANVKIANGNAVIALENFVTIFLDGGSPGEKRGFFGLPPPLPPRGVQSKKSPSGDHPEVKTFQMSYQRSPWVLPEAVFFLTNAELEPDDT